MKIKHYSIFRQPLPGLSSSEAWNVLRTDNYEPHYYIPQTKEEYIAKIDEPLFKTLAEWVIAQAELSGCTHIFSIGSGKSYLEYEIKKIKPSLKVSISDYTPSTLLLKKYNIFDEVYQLDAFEEPFPVSNRTLLILPRIDTEFSDEQFRRLIKKCYDTGLERICFIPTQLLSVRIFLAECKMFVRSVYLRRKRTFCGYFRTVSLFRSLISPYYTMIPSKCNSQKVFVLHKCS